MTNLERYNEIFMTTLGVKEEELDSLEYQGVTAWDSVGHMELMSAIEDAFDIMIDTDDIIDFNSYKKGQEILSKEAYGVEF